ncbi:hypothetical protein QCA50_013402 [Cerrena zonata]|uniref:Uncharacterized protein n=1 Tax=Cerrena zonata TaxID=2478898 RepID=A0AAW0FW01_9APHY
MSDNINGSRRVFTTEANDILDAWSKLKDEKEKETFISDAEDRTWAEKLKNREHIDKCRKWFCTFEDEHSQQLKAISKQRLWDIYERLELLGYGDDFMWAVDYMELYGIEIVREPEPPTGRGWVKMCPQVTQYLKEAIRPKRLTEEYRAFLQYCLPSLRTAVAAFARLYGNVFPLLASFANLGEIRKHLDPMSKDDIDLKFGSFKPLLPKLLARWERNVAKRLGKYVRDRSWSINIPANVQPGDLVITYTLCCDSCEQFIPSTGVRPAIHDCAPGLERHQRKLSECDDIYVKVLSQLGAQSWHPESYSNLIGYAQSVLVGCNKGDLATVQELDELDPRLSCKICCDSSGLRKIFHWREAVS